MLRAPARVGTSHRLPATSEASQKGKATVAPPTANSREQRRTFLLIILALLLWQITLFCEVRVNSPDLQLWLGRVNFATVAALVYGGWCFVRRVAQTMTIPSPALLRWLFLLLRLETIVLTLVTLFTPLVDAAERVEQGQALATFGVLFPFYLVHLLGYLVATLVVAFWEGRKTTDLRKRRQLALIGGGILATVSIALVTNALLPFVFGDFRFCDVGTLSVLLFALAIAYAIFVHGLFDLRIVVRTTLVWGVLLAFVLGGYSNAVFLVTQYLTAGSSTLQQFAVFLLAFSFDPLRRFLEKKTDHLLFGSDRKKRRPSRR